jgi:hypothetical protein
VIHNDARTTLTAAVALLLFLGITVAANSRIGMAGSTEPEMLAFMRGRKVHQEVSLRRPMGSSASLYR